MIRAEFDSHAFMSHRIRINLKICDVIKTDNPMSQWQFGVSKENKYNDQWNFDIYLDRLSLSREA